MCNDEFGQQFNEQQSFSHPYMSLYPSVGMDLEEEEEEVDDDTNFLNETDEGTDGTGENELVNMSDPTNPVRISLDANTDALTNSLNPERAEELQPLIEAQNWEGVIQAVSRYEAQDVNSDDEHADEDTPVPVTVEDRYLMIRYIFPEMIRHEEGMMCSLCNELKACSMWQKNGHAGNRYYFCYDCPISHIKSNDGNPWPPENLMPIELTDADFTDELKETIWELCSKQELESSDEIIEPDCSPFNNDPGLLPVFGPGFTSLSRNDSIANSLFSDTNSQINRNGTKLGLMEIMSKRGPYTPLKEAILAVILKKGQQYNRVVNMSDGSQRTLHCVYLNMYYNNTGDTEPQVRYVSYLPPVWDDKKKMVVPGLLAKKCSIQNAFFLSHYWEIFEGECLSKGTDKKAIKHGKYQVDHLCHDNNCFNPNHLTYTKVGEDNQTRHGCVGPPACNHGQYGTPCIIPGPYSGGPKISRGFFPNDVEFVNYIRTHLPLVTSDDLGYPLPSRRQFTNVNFAHDCTKPFDGVYMRRESGLEAGGVCSVCSKISVQMFPNMTVSQRKSIKHENPGNIKISCLWECDTCRVQVCTHHKNNNAADIVHYDKTYHDNLVRQYEERCEYYNQNSNDGDDSMNQS